MNWIKYVALVLAVWNTVVFFVYGIDKLKAKRGVRRIRESTLLLSAAVFGSVGALLGIYIFRHKTKHAKFAIGVPLLLLINIAVLVFAYFLQRHSAGSIAQSILAFAAPFGGQHRTKHPSFL